MRSLEVEYAAKDGMLRYRAIHGRSRFMTIERKVGVDDLEAAIGGIVLNAMAVSKHAHDGVCIRSVREVPWETLG